MLYNVCILIFLCFLLLSMSSFMYCIASHTHTHTHTFSSLFCYSPREIQYFRSEIVTFLESRSHSILHNNPPALISFSLSYNDIHRPSSLSLSQTDCQVPLTPTLSTAEVSFVSQLSESQLNQVRLYLSLNRMLDYKLNDHVKKVNLTVPSN